MRLLRTIFREEGLRGLYKGIDAKLAQTVLNAAFMFAFYERILGFVEGAAVHAASAAAASGPHSRRQTTRVQRPRR